MVLLLCQMILTLIKTKEIKRVKIDFDSKKRDKRGKN